MLLDSKALRVRLLLILIVVAHFFFFIWDAFQFLLRKTSFPDYN